METVRFLQLEREGNIFRLNAPREGTYQVILSSSADSWPADAPIESFHRAYTFFWNHAQAPFCHLFREGKHMVVGLRDRNKGDSYNLRDLGGYPTADGNSIVRYGVFYRSDQPLSFGAEAASLYEELNLHTVVDLRGEQEHAMWPDPVVAGVENIWAPAFAENPAAENLASSLEEVFQQSDDAKQRSIDHLTNNYRIMAFRNSAFDTLFRLMLKTEATPILFHCLAGKDRTGVAALLILAALGVSHETILHDYTYRSDSYNRYLSNWEVQLQDHLQSDIAKTHFRGFFSVDPKSLELVFEEIFQQYGSWEEFFWDNYQLTEADLLLLRTKFLQPLF